METCRSVRKILERIQLVFGVNSMSLYPNETFKLNSIAGMCTYYFPYGLLMPHSGVIDLSAYPNIIVISSELVALRKASKSLSHSIDSFIYAFYDVKLFSSLDTMQFELKVRASSHLGVFAYLTIFRPSVCTNFRTGCRPC